MVSTSTKIGVVSVVVLAAGAWAVSWLSENPVYPGGDADYQTTTTNNGDAALAPASGLADRSPAHTQSNQAGERPYASKSEFLKSHLKTAPEYLRTLARDMFLKQAKHFEAKIMPSSGFDSLEDVMAGIDSQFNARLRMVVAERLSAGEGLLVVDGEDYQSRIKNSHYLLGNTGEVMFGVGVSVLVVLDPPDSVLQEIDRSFSETRTVWLMDRLQVFNNLTYDERYKEIEAYRMFQKARPRKKPSKDWFGIAWEHHKLLAIQATTMQVLPVGM